MTEQRSEQDRYRIEELKSLVDDGGDAAECAAHDLWLEFEIVYEGGES